MKAQEETDGASISEEGVAEAGPSLFVMDGLAPGFAFSVLRRTYKNRTNHADAWVHSKLHPHAGDAPLVHTMQWLPNCRRFDVLLPTGVADTFLNPAFLMHSFEAEAGPFRKDLVIHIKITVLDDRPLHEWFERARAFSAVALTAAPSLPVVVALHDPSATVMRRPPAAHVHIMVPARELGLRGWGATTDLAVDAAHAEFAKRWSEMK